MESGCCKPSQLAEGQACGKSSFALVPGSASCTFPALDEGHVPSQLSDPLCPPCLAVGQVPGRGQWVVDQLLPGSGAQHVLKDTDGLAALGLGREPEAGVDTGSWRKSSFKTH